MAWVLLTFAIVFEIAATTMLKLSEGLEKLAWAGAAIGCYAICFLFLAPTLKMLPVGVVYAIWSGVGVAAIVGIGTFAFNQPLNVTQMCYVGFILIGTVGLNLTVKAH